MIFTHPNPKQQAILRGLRFQLMDALEGFLTTAGISCTFVPTNSIAFIDENGSVMPIQAILHHDEDGYELLLMPEDDTMRAGLTRWCRDPDMFYVDERFSLGKPILRAVLGKGFNVLPEAFQTLTMALTFCLDERRRQREAQEQAAS